MQSIIEILIGLFLILCTLVIHGYGMYLVMHRFEINWPKYLHERNELRRQFYFGHLVPVMLFAHFFEILLIAGVLYAIKAMPGMRTAFYFTGEVYTTVGFGDILLPDKWRQLALFIAMSGLFSFGWSTGVLVNIVRKTYEAQFSNLRKRID